MPIRYRTMKDLKEKTKSVLGDLRRSVVVITNRGKPEAILRPFTEDELLALQLLESKHVRAVLERAVQDARAGRTVPAAAVIEQAAASVYKTQVEPLAPSERAEVDAHIKSLAAQPLPEQRSNRVIRIRDVSAPVQPFFAARTQHFMIFHTVEGDRVVILGVFPARLRT